MVQFKKLSDLQIWLERNDPAQPPITNILISYNQATKTYEVMEMLK